MSGKDSYRLDRNVIQPKQGLRLLMVWMEGDEIGCVDERNETDLYILNPITRNLQKLRKPERQFEFSTDKRYGGYVDHQVVKRTDEDVEMDYQRKLRSESRKFQNRCSDCKLPSEGAMLLIQALANQQVKADDLEKALNQLSNDKLEFKPVINFIIGWVKKRGNEISRLHLSELIPIIEKGE